MRRITKRIRDEAILICAVEASTPSVAGDSHHVANMLGCSREAGAVAVAAWSKAWDRMSRGALTCEVHEYAEAECLLREGFTP